MTKELDLFSVPNAFKHSITEDEIWNVFLNQEINGKIRRTP